MKKAQRDFRFTQGRMFQILILFCLFHILIITASNYLVQMPLQLFGFHTTWGAFTFPFIFLATDLTVRIFGAPLARKIILSVMFPALVISYLTSSLFLDDVWQGFTILTTLNVMAARIAIASFSAYVLGQMLDVLVFNRLRQLKAWWIAPTASAIFGNMSDTLSFFFIAFYQSADPFFAAHWVELGVLDYSFKIFVCVVFFVPMYGMLLKALIHRLLAGEENYLKQI